MNNRIQIIVEVEPDFTVIREKDNAYTKYLYLFSHDFCIVVDCEKDGTDKKYAYPKYHGVRIKNGKVQWLNPSLGWQIDDKATEKYIELEAEKEILK